MSQLETNPLINNTQQTQNLNQVINTLPTTVVTDFGSISTPFSEIQKYTMPITDFQRLTAMEKFIGTVKWSSTDTSTSTPLNIMKVDWKTLSKLVPIGRTVFSFAQYGHLMLSIKKTDNAFFQGALIVSFDPSPSENFYKDLYGIELDTKHLWQFKKVLIEPKTSGDINLSIPLNYIFNFLPGLFNTYDPSYEVLAGDYLTDYLLGTLRFNVIVPLESKNTTVSLEYVIRASLVELSFAGNVISDNPVVLFSGKVATAPTLDEPKDSE